MAKRTKPKILSLVPGSIGLMSAILLVVLVSTFITLRFQQIRMTELMLRETGLAAAREHSAAISAIHSYYSNTIVPRAKAAGMSFTTDPETDLKALPFPATFVRSVESKVGTSAFRVFSRVPWDAMEKGKPADNFEARALTVIENDPTQDYAEFSEIEHGMQLQYATSIRMEAQCVECHNSMQESPKRDWKLGDIRGVDALTLNLPSIPTFFSFGDMRFPLMGFFLLFLFMVTPSIVFLIRLSRAQEAVERERLATERDRALASSASKTNFLASMSHELRTPLNAIIGFSQLIEIGGKDMTRKRCADYASDIHSSGRHLLTLVDDLLDLAKIESGKIELEETSFSVLKSLDVCSLLCDRLAMQHKVSIAIEANGLSPILYGDELLFKQIMINLLTNAIKFSRPESSVAIDLSLENGALAIRFIDSGVGIAADQISRLFDPYEQADSNVARTYGGTGLGLAITKQYVELHGGTIDIVSKSGEGTTVTVSFPACRITQDLAESAA